MQHNDTSQTNWDFLVFYQPYIIEEYRRYYFAYDYMKKKYKVLQKHNHNYDIKLFENDLYLEINRINIMLKAELHEMDKDLDRINLQTAQYVVNHKGSKVANEFTVERAIRELYEKSKKLNKFYLLNQYVIAKTGKKFEKSLEKSREGRKLTVEDMEFGSWSRFPSGRLFNCNLPNRRDKIQAIRQRCIDTYTTIFRKTYRSLAIGELEYTKDHQNVRTELRLELGFKIGFGIALMIWMISDSFASTNELNFFNMPGLFIYSSFGNFLLYRFTWAMNVKMWTKRHVDYISLLELPNFKSNTLQIMDETASLFLLFFVNMFLYSRSNMVTSPLYNTFLTYACPLLLLLWGTVYLVYKSLMHLWYHQLDGNLFSLRVLWNCLIAPGISVTFRDAYAADVLTSFTKVISDSVRASCWVVSGSFLSKRTIKNYGSAYMNCTSPRVGVVIAACVLLPLWIRLAQCFRNLLDTKLFFPHAYNCVKYLFGIVIILYGVSRNVTDIAYLTLIVVATLYKWWWDVVMDWGLFDVLPAWDKPYYGLMEPNFLLRSSLMYPRHSVYYVGIVLDLILRFAWVVSLAPSSAMSTLHAAPVSIFLGSLEIFRRALWGHFRLEYEHLKFVAKDVPGFLAVHDKPKQLFWDHLAPSVKMSSPGKFHHSQLNNQDDEDEERAYHARNSLNHHHKVDDNDDAAAPSQLAPGLELTRLVSNTSASSLGASTAASTAACLHEAQADETRSRGGLLAALEALEQGYDPTTAPTAHLAQTDNIYDCDDDVDQEFLRNFVTIDTDYYYFMR